MSWAPGAVRARTDDHDAALALYDHAIAGGLALTMDLIDAGSMLWRLRLRGVDVGSRWQPVADRWAALAAVGGEGQYAFNDLHAMLAYVGADRVRDQQRLHAAPGTRPEAERPQPAIASA